MPFPLRLVQYKRRKRLLVRDLGHGPHIAFVEPGSDGAFGLELGG